MSYVHCEQLRYTWAERRLDGRGGGFGIVARSRNWPSALLERADVREHLTSLSLAARQLPADDEHAFAVHLRLDGGSLMIAKRAIGTDGAGRPGNYAVHALFDPTCTLGALDLHDLIAGGTFRLDRSIDAEPEADAPALAVYTPGRWTSRASRTSQGAAPGPLRWAGATLRCADLAELEVALADLSTQIPAALVNTLDVDAGGEPVGAVERDSGQHRDLVQTFAMAAELGAPRDDLWWTRQSWDVGGWSAELEDYVLLHQPVGRVPGPSLPARWDASTPTGRRAVVDEMLRRQELADDPEVQGQVATRPRLLDALAERGLPGTKRQRRSALGWICAIGSEELVVEAGAELLARNPDEALELDLVRRLSDLDPELLPGPLRQAVLVRLDAGESMSPGWKQLALVAFVAGRPSCPGADELARSATPGDLATALTAAVGSGADPTACYDALAVTLEPGRLASVFASASPGTASYLLERGLPLDPQGQPIPLAAVLPVLARTLGWADPVVRELASVQHRLDVLRRQRMVLLVLVAGLVLVVVVLAVLFVP